MIPDTPPEYQQSQPADSSERLTKRGWEVLRREQDGTVYATKCHDCGAAWKVYQRCGCGCERAALTQGEATAPSQSSPESPT